MVSGAAVQTLPNHAQESQDDVSSQANSLKKLFAHRPPGVHRAPRGPQDPLQGQKKTYVFFDLLAVLGAWRHPRGFPELVGTILSKYQPKRTHLDLLQRIFDVFLHFPCMFQFFLARKFAIVGPRNRLIT